MDGVTLSNDVIVSTAVFSDSTFSETWHITASSSVVCLTQVPLSRSLMGDATAVKTLQSTPLRVLSSLDHGGLVYAACNGVWICPQHKDMLYVCRGSVIGLFVYLFAYAAYCRFYFANTTTFWPFFTYVG